MAEEIPLIEPEELVIKDKSGNDRVYILSDFDAVNGREIVALYPTSNLPKVGDYAVSKATMFKLMSYVAVPMPNGQPPLRLSTEALINNHVPTSEMLAKIEWAMMVKNCSFFRDGRSLDFFDNLAQVFLQKLTEMLTLSSASSSTVEKQPSTNSEQSTA